MKKKDRREFGNVQKKILPLGIENFEDLIKNDFYYVDKTGLIRELLQNLSLVTLFTRPRRFGKSLNMSMLKSFFSVSGDRHLFDGLEISKDTALCEQYMGKFPVISISLKGIEALNYEGACKMAVQIMNRAASEMDYLGKSSRLSEEERAAFRKLLDSEMDEAALIGSLQKLSQLLAKHHGSKTVILIDEYDVPLAKAFTNGYYN